MAERAKMPAQVRVMIGFQIVVAALWVLGLVMSVVSPMMGASLADGQDPAAFQMGQAFRWSLALVVAPLLGLAAWGLARMRFWGVVLSWLGFGALLFMVVMVWTAKHLLLANGVQTDPLSAAGIAINAVLLLFAVWASQCLYRMNDRFVCGKW